MPQVRRRKEVTRRRHRQLQQRKQQHEQHRRQCPLKGLQQRRWRTSGRRRKRTESDLCFEREDEIQNTQVTHSSRLGSIAARRCHQSSFVVESILHLHVDGAIVGVARRLRWNGFVVVVACHDVAKVPKMSRKTKKCKEMSKSCFYGATAYEKRKVENWSSGSPTRENVEKHCLLFTRVSSLRNHT